MLAHLKSVPYILSLYLYHPNPVYFSLPISLSPSLSEPPSASLSASPDGSSAAAGPGGLLVCWPVLARNTERLQASLDSSRIPELATEGLNASPGSRKRSGETGGPAVKDETLLHLPRYQGVGRMSKQHEINS